MLTTNRKLKRTRPISGIYKILNIDKTCIAKCARGINKTAKGRKWKYL